MDLHGIDLNLLVAFDPRSSAAATTLGLSEHPAFVLLPHLVERLREVAPAMTVRSRSFPARGDGGAMRDAGEADLAGGGPPRPPPRAAS